MRTKKGVITSAKMTGTVTVTVHRHVFHPIYKKRFRKSKKFLADTAGNDLNVGDTVVIGECRPLSKTKCFTVLEVLKKAAQTDTVVEDESTEKAIHREKVAPEQKPAASSEDNPESKQQQPSAAADSDETPETSDKTQDSSDTTS